MSHRTKHNKNNKIGFVDMAENTSIHLLISEIKAMGMMQMGIKHQRGQLATILEAIELYQISLQRLDYIFRSPAPVRVCFLQDMDEHGVSAAASRFLADPASYGYIYYKKRQQFPHSYEVMVRQAAHAGQDFYAYVEKHFPQIKKVADFRPYALLKQEQIRLEKMIDTYKQQRGMDAVDADIWNIRHSINRDGLGLHARAVVEDAIRRHGARAQSDHKLAVLVRYVAEKWESLWPRLAS